MKTNKINRRTFSKTLGFVALSTPFIGFGFERLPKQYHKIIKDWSISCGSVQHWNDFNVYSKVGLSKDKNLCFGYMDNENEYVLRGENNFIYVNKDKCYEISNFKGDFVGKNHEFYEASFDIIKYLGPTPIERIIIISGFDYCIYALGRDYYKEVEKDFPPFGVRKGWVLDRREVFSPLTEKMHSKVKYFDWNRKTYKEYLQTYNTKLKELGLI